MSFRVFDVRTFISILAKALYSAMAKIDMTQIFISYAYFICDSFFIDRCTIFVTSPTSMDLF